MIASAPLEPALPGWPDTPRRTASGSVLRTRNRPVTRLLIIGSPVSPGPAEAVQRAALAATGALLWVLDYPRLEKPMLSATVSPGTIAVAGRWPF